jgi:hypothetical protein
MSAPPRFVAVLERQHEEMKSLESLIRNAVVKANAQASDGMMTAKLIQTNLLGLRNKELLKRSITAANTKRHGCPWSEVRVHSVRVKSARAINEFVKLRIGDMI